MAEWWGGGQKRGRRRAGGHTEKEGRRTSGGGLEAPVFFRTKGRRTITAGRWYKSLQPFRDHPKNSSTMVRATRQVSHWAVLVLGFLFGLVLSVTAQCEHVSLVHVCQLVDVQAAKRM